MTDEYQPTNREKAREPRSKSFWCCSCDCNLVNAGEVCRVCGSRSGKTRSKAGKATPK